MAARRPLKPTRRAFLYGVGGVTVCLPFLAGLARHAQAASRPKYAIWMRTANGVTQADPDSGELDQFWPSFSGPLTASELGADTTQVTSELADFAEQLLMVQGCDYAFDHSGCGHAGGGNQLLTGARCSVDPGGAMSLAMGESVDSYIARQFDHNGGQPLTLYTGPRTGWIDEVMSYRGSRDLRPAEDDPWNAYQRMLGMDPGSLDPLLDDRRLSVNDLVRDQIKALRRSAALSQDDQRRLDQHFESIREFERLSQRLSADEEQQMAYLHNKGTLNDNRLIVARMHIDLLALAFSADFCRVGTLQVGDGADKTQYLVDGVRLEPFHFISHRVQADALEGLPLEGALEKHHAIDRMHAQLYRYLLDKLDSYGILDRCMAVWCSDVASGPNHSFVNLPFIIGGSAGGFLKQGMVYDAGGVSHAQLLNVFINGMGLRNEDGSYIDDFGDEEIPPGLLEGLLA